MAIQRQFEDGILHLTIDHPTQGNSFGLEAAESLLDSLRTAQNLRDCQGLMLTATGRLFCAGGNLDDYARMQRASEGRKVNRRISKILGELRKWPLPTVCAVSGDCYGGGVELISTFDKILSAPHVLLGLWQRRVALSFGWGGAARLAERIGEARLRQLAIEARSLSAYEALRIGLVDEVHLPNLLEQRAREWLTAQAHLPRGPIEGLKTLAVDREQTLFERLWWSREHREILRKRRARRS